MIRVSRNIQHGAASSPFKTTEPTDSYHHQRPNRNKKGVVWISSKPMQTKQNTNNNNNNNNNETFSNNNNKNVSRKFHTANSNSSAAVRISPPLKEIQSNFSNNSNKLMSDGGSDHSDNEGSLFAGSKSYVSPSPSDLPKPPQNWMNDMIVIRSSQQQQQTEDVIAVGNTDVNNQDSAILVVCKTSKCESPVKKKQQNKTRKKF